MKILVTGAAGFIGSHVAEALLNRGDAVVGLDNFNDYYDPARKRANVKAALLHSQYRLIEGDVRDEQLLQDLFARERFDKICHIAAMAGVRYSIQHPELYESVNVRGTLNLLELARQHDIQNLVFASSSSVYGASTPVPFREDAVVNRPISPYAATKVAKEVLAYTYHHLYGLNCTGLRFFTVYGPRGRPDMAPYLFTKWIAEGQPLRQFGDGSSQRDYTFVTDIVAGVVAAIDANLPYELINLGRGETIYLTDFIQVVEEIVGKAAAIVQEPPKPGDVPVTFADITKARELLGYEPTVSVVDGMHKFWEWYQAEVL
ncbi:MAG: GDP-mannose 4,6-dehydratase [Anaerolineae bacterium]|nr:GDP-mannose 4,6-dehydratase [Anaerolineae bacterium]